MKRKPEGFIVDGTVYINKDILVRELKKFGKFMANDYKRKREDYIQELIDYEDNVNIRMEEAFTRACAKKIKETTEYIIRYINDSKGYKIDGEETKRPTGRPKQTPRR